jgi:hypothetical protein
MANSKPLQRSPVALRRTGGGLGIHASKPKLMKISHRRLLDFVPEQPNPHADLPHALTLENKCDQEVSAFGKAFRKAAKDEAAAAAHELEGYGAECFVCVFTDAAQATSFLKAVGYPEPYDVFVDGPLLAELLKVKINASLVAAPKKLKIHHDKKILPLITRRL